MIKKIFIILGLAVLVSMLLSEHYKQSGSPRDRAIANAAEAARKDIGLAEATCQYEFERRAHDPSSVNFIREEREFSFTNPEQTKAISKQPVRAKNAAGNLVRSILICQLSKKNNDWTITKLQSK